MLIVNLLNHQLALFSRLVQYTNMKLLLLTTVILSCLIYHVQSQNYRSDRDVARQMMKYVSKSQSKEDIDEFQQIITLLSFPSFIYRENFSSFGKGRQTLTCMTCRSVVTTLIKLHNDGYTEEELIDVMSDFCTLLQIQPGHVCRGLVELNAPIFIYILGHQPLFTPEAFCGVVFQTNDKNSCPFFDPRYDWSVDIPSKGKINNKIPSGKADTTFKLAHITDIHYDPAYEANGLAECDEPTCCRVGQKRKMSRQQRSLKDPVPDDRVYVDKDIIYADISYANKIKSESQREGQREMAENSESKADRAGYWGDYRNCDTPWWAVEAGIDHITENHNIEYVYYTGDTIDHGVWETSKEMITQSLNITFNKLQNAFRNKQVFCGIGNHESQPLNQYAPPTVTDPEVSTAWLYELLTEKWSAWLPNEALDTIKMGGYYTVLVKPGFRVVVLNSNLCYVYNWWIHLDPEDPSGQFKWLVDTLLAAENAGEKVHILSHIPNALTDVYSVCSREYKRIIERFSDIITAEFNGHTHNDEFKVYYEKKNSSKAIHVAWNGGSLTPYSFVNPNYRIFEVDSDTSEIIDFETWYYNLTEANLKPEELPTWYNEYSFKDFYNLLSLKPVELDRLVNKMVTTGKELLSIHYHAFRGKSSDTYFKECDDNCVKNNLCYITTSELYDNAKCETLWQTYNETDIRH
ncbi:sphingomyelin phosphodiesterase 1-like [Arctopsyche grandis]|uniref:sphingomyelin phosphodiesterase 1-like n=1 Tax=Arctopsyche grandis TaxID=121162 RepID=UPI00406D965F